jgi:hypothetical protein
MSPQEGDMSIPVVDPADDATRQLASAVHLDDQLADVLVEEFLLEPKRAVPPSPSVRAEEVLREAVAAQARRRITNAVILLLLALVAVVGLLVVALWAASGLGWRIGSLIVTTYESRLHPQSVARRRIRGWLRWWITAVLWQIFYFVVGAVIFAYFRATQQNDQNSGAVTAGAGLVVTLVLLLMFLVLLTNALLRRNLVDTRFSYGTYRPDAPPRPFAAWAAARHAGRLQRIAQEDARHQQPTPAEVVVFRSHDPFVGAGVRVSSWSKAFELHADDNAKTTEIPTFRPAELQDFVTAELEALRKTPTLTPGWRFSGLQISHWALLSSRQLLHYRAAGPLLAQLDACTNPTLHEHSWFELIDSSPEWLRYYRCYRVEAWERQLAVTGYLHVGCEQRTLYLEWNGYVLPPVATEYRNVDDPPSMPLLRAAWQAVCQFALLPTTAPGRIADLTRGLWELTGVGRGRWRTPAQAGRVFGAHLSMREVGAGDELTSFFEVSDSDRYLKIMERRVLEAVHKFLAAKHISTAELDRMTTQINNSTVLNHCDVIAGNVGGHSNIATVQTGTVGAGKPTGQG